MCGIAGFFGQRPVDRRTMAAMLDSLSRRGPDARHAVCWDERWTTTDGAAPRALLHTRLSIRDPRPIADQPMTNADQSIWICYNGEVYGWETMAETLAKDGTFETRSDTEFILRGYEAWGLTALLPKLRGMFALAILDLRIGKLFLVRDRLGLKPIVYHQGVGEFAFASTVRALLPYLPPERRRFSPLAIDAYLAHRYVPAPQTIFEGVARLENGHYLSLDLASGAAEKTRYWQPQPLEGDWRAALDEAIRLRTVADRPVGLFLSGGVDSTLLAVSLARQGYTNIGAYTAAFPGASLDESADAARTAAALGLPHHAVPIAEDIGRDFAQIVADLDEPFADPSAFPLWYLSRDTSKEVKVVLSGDGGDELFAGYKRYAKHLRSAWRGAFRLPSLFARPGGGRLGDELSLTWLEAYSLRFSGLAPHERRALQPDLRGAPPVHWRSLPPTGMKPLEQLLWTDMHNYLPEYILRKGDLCTMAHGLELRAPLLDHVWVQHVLGLPDEERFTTPAKALFRPLMAPITAPFETKKRGFNPPLAAWLRKDLAARLAQLPAQLEALTGAQVSRRATQRFVAAYLQGNESRAEQVLQLAVLAESLAQLHGQSRLH